MPKVNQTQRAVKLRATLARKAAHRRMVRETLDFLEFVWRNGRIDPGNYESFARSFGQLQAEWLHWSGIVHVYVCKGLPTKLQQSHQERGRYIEEGSALNITLVLGPTKQERTSNHWFAVTV